MKAKKVDLVNDTTSVDVRYRLPAGSSGRSDAQPTTDDYRRVDTTGARS